ncbi:MAG: hypothetical protein Q9186_001134 [Xanthomendoza sp. 1 TL-2023]
MATGLNLDHINAGLAEMTENVGKLREMEKALKEREATASTRDKTAAAQEQALLEREQALKAREKDVSSATEKLVIQATAILAQYSSNGVVDQKQQLATDSKSPNDLSHSSTKHTAAPKKGPQHHQIQWQRQEHKVKERTEGIVVFESPEDRNGPTTGASRLGEHASRSSENSEQPIQKTAMLDSTRTPTMEASTSITRSAKRNSIPSSVLEGTEQEARCKRARVDTSSAIPDNSQSQRPRKNVDPPLADPTESHSQQSKNKGLVVLKPQKPTQRPLKTRKAASASNTALLSPDGQAIWNRLELNTAISDVEREELAALLSTWVDGTAESMETLSRFVDRSAKGNKHLCLTSFLRSRREDDFVFGNSISTCQECRRMKVTCFRVVQVGTNAGVLKRWCVMRSRDW